MRLPHLALAAATAALCGLLAGTTAADELHIWGKDPVKGKVIFEDDAMIKFKTESGEVLEVERSMIRKLYTDAETEARDAAKPDTPTPGPAPSDSTAPAIPTAKKPAGGWMMLLTKDSKVLGFRAVEMKRQGTGFVLEEQYFQLNSAGSPHFVTYATLTFGPEMQCLGSASRLIMKGRGRKPTDNVQRMRMGPGEVAIELQDRGAGAKEAPRYPVPKRTIFRGAELALLLHGTLAMDLVEEKEIAPMHFPMEYALQHDGKDPDGNPIPMVAVVKFERVGVSAPDAASGFRTLAVKVRELDANDRPVGPTTRYELAVKAGAPVKLLKVEQAGAKGFGGTSLPRQVHAAMRAVKEHAIYDMVPREWRDLEMPIAPEPLLPSKEK
ncbi:MAG: hypothetical protein ACYTGX_04180 [Planctomycetota bacterium]|jgi:hypothetical protein